ncbi:MAG: DUF6653 family protein [Pseudomonadota bacterium]
MADIFRGAERLMTMDDAAWRRHANPWSVWTRFTVLPLIMLAVWSRVWLGWGAVVPVAAALVWAWWNPRAFPPAPHLHSWASRAVLGERVFLTHRAEIPAHHRRVAIWLTWASLPGAVVMVWGLIALWWEGAVFGMLLTMLPKVWFCDRMVWILQDWRAAGRAVPGMEGP